MKYAAENWMAQTGEKPYVPEPELLGQEIEARNSFISDGLIRNGRVAGRILA